MEQHLVAWMIIPGNRSAWLQLPNLHLFASAQPFSASQNEKCHTLCTGLRSFKSMSCCQAGSLLIVPSLGTPGHIRG